jgi:HD-GYP domain-containing protein (c-di-GMP phosphodiesterase class II)
MITDRSYHIANTPEEAIAEIRNGCGRRYDPQVVEAFLAIWDRL